MFHKRKQPIFVSGQAYSIDAYAQFPYSPGVFGTGAFGSGIINKSTKTDDKHKPAT